MKKITLIILSLLLAFSAVGCNQSNPETTVKNYLDAAKKFDVETMNSLMANPDEDQFENMIEDESATYIMDYIKEKAEKIDYEILDSTVSDNNAAVEVNTKYVNTSPVIRQAFGEFFTTMMAEAFSGNELSEEETEAILIEKMEEASRELEEEFIEKKITINLVKKESEWYLEQVSDELGNVVTSNFIKTFEDIGEAFE